MAGKSAALGNDNAWCVDMALLHHGQALDLAACQSSLAPTRPSVDDPLVVGLIGYQKIDGGNLHRVIRRSCDKRDRNRCL